MSWVHSTLIVPVAQVPLAQRICSTLPGDDGGKNMFTTGLSATGLAPVTHRVSSGLIRPQFAALIGDAAATYAACQQVPSLQDITLAQITALYTASIIVGPTRTKTITLPGGGTAQVTVDTVGSEVIADAGLKQVGGTLG